MYPRANLPLSYQHILRNYLPDYLNITLDTKTSKFWIYRLEKEGAVQTWVRQQNNKKQVGNWKSTLAPGSEMKNTGWWYPWEWQSQFKVKSWICPLKSFVNSQPWIYSSFKNLEGKRLLCSKGIQRGLWNLTQLK